VVDFFPARVHNSFPYHPPHHKSSRKQCMQRFFEFSLDHLAKRSICTSFADCVVGLGNFLADLLFFVSSHQRGSDVLAQSHLSDLSRKYVTTMTTFVTETLRPPWEFRSSSIPKYKWKWI
jgi:hypothetical protein